MCRVVAVAEPPSATTAHFHPAGQISESWGSFSRQSTSLAQKETFFPPSGPEMQACELQSQGTLHAVPAPAAAPSCLMEEKLNVMASHLVPAVGWGAFFGLDVMFPQLLATHASVQVAFARHPWHARESCGQTASQVVCATPHLAIFEQTSVHVTVAAGVCATEPDPLSLAGTPPTPDDEEHAATEIPKMTEKQVRIVVL